TSRGAIQVSFGFQPGAKWLLVRWLPAAATGLNAVTETEGCRDHTGAEQPTPLRVILFCFRGLS
ncbi:hypothetical protein SAMN05443635_1324, partial [Roseobacter denitrificans OCh 114]